MDKIIVEWVDVSKTINDDDYNLDKNIDDMLSNIETIGWLYKETKNVILLVQEFYNNIPRDYVVIPKVLIKKRVVL